MSTERVVLHPDRARRDDVELFVSRPTGVANRPGILFVHGHQEGLRLGGKILAERGTLNAYAERRAWTAASVSQPGYGGSGGTPDYCGPRTQRAIRAALDFVCRQPTVDRDRIVLVGTSRGAIASAMVATGMPELWGLVLIAGVYDFESAFPRLPPSMRLNFEVEAGLSRTAFRARSALPMAGRIRASTLILHGIHDDRCPVSQSEALASALEEQNASHVTLALVASGHLISSRVRSRHLESFLDRLMIP